MCCIATFWWKYPLINWTEQLLAISNTCSEVKARHRWYPCKEVAVVGVVKTAVHMRLCSCNIHCLGIWASEVSRESIHSLWGTLDSGFFALLHLAKCQEEDWCWLDLNTKTKPIENREHFSKWFKSFVPSFWWKFKTFVESKICNSKNLWYYTTWAMGKKQTDRIFSLMHDKCITSQTIK